jgi:tetratricopeptide (TPR) repeat protein
MTLIQHRLSRLALRVAAFGLLAGLGQPVAVAQDAAAKGYLEEAQQAESAGRYLDALAAYADAAAATPDDPRVYEQRANLFMSLSHPDLASGDYRRAVRLNPDDAVSQANLCWSLALANHDLDGALDACNAAVKREPSSYDALSKRGYVHLRRGAWADAETDFAAALAFNSASPNEMFGHGLATIHLGQEQDGRDEIASATLDSPSLVNEWAARGFGARGEIRPGMPVTTASEPVLSIKEMKLFLNRGAESYFGFRTACGHVLPPVGAAEVGPKLFDHADLAWSAECRFGLIHGEGKLTSAGEDAPVTRYVYGREIAPGEAGEALARKLTRAYQVLEEAARP